MQSGTRASRVPWSSTAFSRDPNPLWRRGRRPKRLTRRWGHASYTCPQRGQQAPPGLAVTLSGHGATEAEPPLVSRGGRHLPGAASHRRPLHERCRRMGGHEQARDLQAGPRGPSQDSTPGRPGDGSRDDVAGLRAGQGPANLAMSDRRSLLVSALGFVLLGNWRSVRELVTLHAWLDTWSGLGAVVVGMERHGFELWLAKDRNGWRSTFLHRSHVMQPWVGQVLYWWPTPWRRNR